MTSRIPKRSIILPSQKTVGWPKGNKKLQELPTDALDKILSTKWKEDTHFVQYAVVEPIGAFRYNNEIFKSPEFEEYRKEGGAIDIIAVAFDVDSPAKKSSEPGALDIWFEAEREKISRIIKAFPGGLVWRTKGGWRGCWYTERRIVSADDTFVWKKDYLAAIVYLEREFGIIADSACNDWNRLHRVPFGIRNTEAHFGFGEPEIRETFGGLAQGRTFDLAAVSLQSDRDEARRRFLTAWKSPPKAREPRFVAKADENDGPIFTGESVWERVLKSRNLIIRELGPGKWAVQCPNVAQHTTLGNETSTVLYAPGPGEILGHVYCAHHHCQGLDWRAVLGIPNEEWVALTRDAISELPRAAEATTIAEAPGNATEDPETAERRVVAGLIPAKNGIEVDGCAANVSHLLLHHPYWKGKLVYDNFKHERYWTEVPDILADIHKFDNRVLSADLVDIQGWLLRGNGHQRPAVRASLEAVRVGLENACTRNCFDSLINHVKKFDGIWDGEPRLDSWLIDYMGAEDTPLNRAIGKRWLISAIARALNPGCIADFMVILEGQQEIGKNYLLNIMFGTEFISVPFGLKIGSKDFDQKSADAWCVHDDELACSQKAGLEETKSWLTQTTAKFRKAHAVDFITVPRRFVVVGSTNRNTYLRDNENRRFWPIYLKKLNDSGLLLVRDQIWSEAVAYFHTKTEYRITKQDPLWNALSETHEERKDADLIQEKIETFLVAGLLKTPFQMSQLADLLDIPHQQRDGKIISMLSRALHRIGLASKLTRHGHGARSRFWFKPSELGLQSPFHIPVPSSQMPS